MMINISKQKLKKILKKIGLLGPANFIWILWWLLSVENQRWFACILFHCSDFFPDLFIIARLRCYILRMAGCKMKSPGTSLIRKGFFTEYANNIEMGSHCNISKDVYFCANDKIIIGNNVGISYGVKITNVSHAGLNMMENSILKPVVLKDGCAIYANAVILPGTVVEEYVFVSAGSILSGATKKGGIYMGNPARLIKMRDDIDV